MQYKHFTSDKHTCQAKANTGQGYSVLRIISWCVLLKVYIVGRVERMRNPTGTKRVGFRYALPDLQMVILKCEK